MKLSSALKRFRGWRAAGVAIAATLAMLLQPFCAPMCAAKHCIAMTGSHAAMHCAGGEDQPENSAVAQKYACSSPEALPAILGADVQQSRRTDVSGQLSSSSAADLRSARPTSAFAFFFPASKAPGPHQNDASLSNSAILRV